MATHEEIQTIKNNFMELIKQCSTLGSSKLDLTLYSLEQLSINDLCELMRKIPKHVTSLDLSCNSLDQLGAEGLKGVLASIPANVSSLNLAANDLFKLNAEGLKGVLASIPANVSSLDLVGNDLEKLGAEGLGTVLSSLPESITTLHLGRLDKLKLVALENALATIPNHITCVHLNIDNLFISESLKNIDDFLKRFCGKEDRFNLSGNELKKYQMNQTKINALKKLCHDYTVHLGQKLSEKQTANKLKIMQELVGFLSDDNDLIHERLSKFAKCLSDNKTALQEHRDSMWTRFMTSILHVLSLGLYSKFTKGTFAFWKSHGEVVCNNLEQIQPNSSIN